MQTAIVWFRQDLRCEDNPALAVASQNCASIIPLYIAASVPQQTVGAAQCWWLHHALEDLHLNLQKHGLTLCLRHGDALKHLLDLAKKHQVDTVYWNRCYEPESIARDTAIKTALKKLGITAVSFNGSLLNEPWTVLNQKKNYFKVFTPFWRQAYSQVVLPDEFTLNLGISSPTVETDKLDDWQLLPTKPNWAKAFSEHWQPGEQGALIKLTEFIENNLQSYKEDRDKPALSISSHLSPHLHFGEISPWKIWRAIAAEKGNKACNLASAEHFLSEIGWREFAYYLLYHFPELPVANFKSQFDSFAWEKNSKALIAWQQGQTGYPIVDAGMRELWHTGYMHNRVRMIVASFLIKDLLIDWREGAKWFMYTLLDADLANNSAGWQWVAGSGADAAPYFRIFNPILQGEKFDGQGEYIRKWLPELKNVPNKWIHKPWEAPQLPIQLGKDYPYPLVDHAIAREQALVNYGKISKI